MYPTQASGFIPSFSTVSSPAIPQERTPLEQELLRRIAALEEQKAANPSFHAVGSDKIREARPLSDPEEDLEMDEAEKTAPASFKKSLDIENYAPFLKILNITALQLSLLTPEKTEEIRKKLLSMESALGFSADKIIRAVAEYFNCTPQDLLKKEHENKKFALLLCHQELPIPRHFLGLIFDKEGSHLKKQIKDFGENLSQAQAKTLTTIREKIQVTLHPKRGAPELSKTDEEVPPLSPEPLPRQLPHPKKLRKDDRLDLLPGRNINLRFLKCANRKEICQSMLNFNNQRGVSVAKIIQATADFFKTTSEEILVAGHREIISQARKYALYLCEHELHPKGDQLGLIFSRTGSTLFRQIRDFEKIITAYDQKSLESIRQKLYPREPAVIPAAASPR